ncbi:MAG TPA: Gfo/Idh/MocA family oxidoreductase [Planctomycetota bacterium]|nr:Gfo/Idh/MocA family oxidoreductase [Planctomycetota bacterium]HRR81591.1 Gfo/Idh/MocA family oxidoreductase [Planctomycetota bacterium]HRT94856.1 Gfo/Idh/MocA family oxidoreductase [Planctomycetota bacterium]
MNRRTFVMGAAALSVAATRRSLAAEAPKATYRVGVIGHTGRGNYGHGLDTVWREVPGTQVVAVADADEKGLAAAVKRLNAPKGYADYRELLDREKPDLVSIGPRWLDQHRDMVVAAAERGVRGIYLEKPLCRTLAEADEMAAACERHGAKLAVAHQTRYSPRLPVVRELLRSGALGQVLELRGRGKEDARGGGEDLWVLGSHVLDLILVLGGEPKSCFATVLQGGRPISKADVKDGAEGIGPLAGDEVHATYRLASGATATFDSVRKAGGEPTRFGVQVFGSKGILELYPGYPGDVYLLPDPSWSPGRTGKKWLPVTSAGVDKPEPLQGGGLDAGNVAAVKDLLAAVEGDRQPECHLAEVRTATEMIVAVFESHRLGRPVAFPLQNRQNPLTMLP